jgi:hypothetical protein
VFGAYFEIRLSSKITICQLGLCSDHVLMHSLVKAV